MKKTQKEILREIYGEETFNLISFLFDKELSFYLKGSVSLGLIPKIFIDGKQFKPKKWTKISLLWGGKNNGFVDDIKLVKTSIVDYINAEAVPPSKKAIKAVEKNKKYLYKLWNKK